MGHEQLTRTGERWGGLANPALQKGKRCIWSRDAATSCFFFFFFFLIKKKISRLKITGLGEKQQIKELA